jgi:uncharacterized protein DUF5694
MINTAAIKPIVMFILFSVSLSMHAQTINKIPVLTLGTFHFNFPNLDVQQIDPSDQIDVLNSKYQQEIEGIVSDLSKFKPTIIAIERRPDQQFIVDSLYQEYLIGTYQLSRGEDEQIGFRLAKASAIKKLSCVDEWGNFNENVSEIMERKDSIRTQQFESFYYNNPDSTKKTKIKPTIRANGIRRELLLMNDKKRIRESLGDYLV